MSAAHPTIVRMGGLACFIFVACGALRLARFNMIGRAHRPALFRRHADHGRRRLRGLGGGGLARPGGQQWPAPSLVMALMVAVGTLMVSTVRFPSSKQA
jgi:CDP-diacylglycerol--serine O-phosphatidyltransferase